MSKEYRVSRFDIDNKERYIPYISRELVDWLDRMYPEVIPEANQSRDKIMKYAGKRELVLKLKEIAYNVD